MSSKEVMEIINNTGTDQATAEKALESSGGNVLEAIISLTSVPEVSGQKYIPAVPKVDDGLTPEVREQLMKARKLADLLTFSAKNDLRAAASHHPQLADVTEETA
jgi:hypothetical protein